MKITFKRDDKKVSISLDRLIHAIWKDSDSPIEVEMSKEIGDVEILAKMDLCPEEKWCYPDITLESRNHKLHTSATWFSLEAPNSDSPFVTGYLYAGDDTGETGELIGKLVDAPREKGDDSRRLLHVNRKKVHMEDMSTIQKIAETFPQVKYAATEQQFCSPLTYEKLGKCLASKEGSGIEYVDGMIVSKDEATINQIADIMDAFGYVATTGYFDPAEDKKQDSVDCLTGYYYCEI